MNRFALSRSMKVVLCLLSFGLTTPAFAQNQIFDGIDFVQVTGLDYQFGSPDNQEGNTYFEKQYNLLMSHTFWMSKYEITQAQWEAVMGYNPSTHKALGPVVTQPVETVSWNDIQLFVNRLNAQAGGEYYRLPTEAEWEFVAKANTTTRWSFGDSSNQLGTYTYVDGSPLPRSIGGRQANPYGIHDLYGNVYEWVEDWYVLDRDPDYAACPPESGTFKVLRGGSNAANLKYTRSTSRNFAHPDRRSWQIGFRLVRVANPADDLFRSGERCKRGVPGVDFFVDSMTTTCSAYDHNGITGDDRGGIAYGYDHVYYTGDTRTVKASTTLGNPTGITQRDGLLSNLATEEVYHLGMNGSLVAGRNTNFNQLIKLDANLNPTNEILNLSKTVTTKDTNGIFSGYGEVLFFFNNTYHAVNFVTGEVESFPGSITELQGCENWASWGFSERIEGIRYVTYRRSGNQTVVRYDIETGDMFTVASFNDVNDMCSITVSPSTQKWFFHYEGSAQLGNGSEVIGSCNANVQVRVDPKFCGNGDLNLGEFCDDGNRSSLDGCTADCKVAFCGDGFLRGNSNEECDDGNNINGDGCDANCLIEQCGSGRVEGNEPCDDGNNSNLDECTNACVVATCGDGFVRANSAEECDDNNNVSGDGCDTNCLVEQCGNGRREDNEGCDDGNLVAGDGCDASCRTEARDSCLGHYDSGSRQDGIYTLTGGYNVYCDMTNGGWTLVARFSNADSDNWMLDSGNWWYDRTSEHGATTQTNVNADMFSKAFYTAPGTGIKFSRADLGNTALFQTTVNCMGGRTFRSHITRYGNFRNGTIWADNSVRGTCNGTFGGQYASTQGFEKAHCNGNIGRPNSISFWAAYGRGDGAVIMMGGGGNNGCSRADHGIGITEANQASFVDSGTGESDFGFHGRNGTSNYAINMWIK